jgi:hypothetical protein
MMRFLETLLILPLLLVLSIVAALTDQEDYRDV